MPHTATLGGGRRGTNRRGLGSVLLKNCKQVVNIPAVSATNPRRGASYEDVGLGGLRGALRPGVWLVSPPRQEDMSVWQHP
jgi:hypothetical protein